MSQDGPILFFDGVCNLCNRCVDFLIRRDRKGTLRYGPLQGATALAVLPPELTGPNLSSLVLADSRGVHRRSTAFLHALRHIGGIWSALGSALLLVPRPLRDWVYDRVAERRFRIWGSRETCRVPTAEESARFVD